MARRWYGSVQNRLEEGRQFVKEIKVGTGVTEYSYSDREAYEVTEVRDQKHITIRKYDHKHVGDGCMDNNWELISNVDNPEYDLTKRGDYWYFTVTVTKEQIENRLNDWDLMLWLVHVGIDKDKVMEKGKVTKYRKANISIGRADYYYDYEF